MIHACAIEWVVVQFHTERFVMSKSEVAIPSQLNEELINDIIRGVYKRSDCNGPIKYNITPAAAPGDNYISDIFRIFVETGEGNHLYIVVKSRPTSGFNVTFIQNACLFEKEIAVYNTVLPSMCQGLKCDSFRFAPQCYLTRPYSLIVLEDLTMKDYRTVDRRTGLDLEHCIEALKCLAYFHALSLNVSNEQMLTDFRDTLYDGKGKEHACKYVTNCVQSVADRVEKWPGYEKFGNKLRKIAATSCDKVLSLFESNKPFRVLNHGDYWTKNIMFKYDENSKISDVKILDFQMCRYVSPALDILYFLYTSPQEDVRVNRKTVLLDEYCREFNKTTLEMNMSYSLSPEVLRLSMEENEFFGFLNAIMMLPAVLSGPEEAPDLENVAQGTSEMNWLSGERFRLQFQNILNESEGKEYL